MFWRREPKFDRDAWLKQSRERAEELAKRVLAGERIPSGTDRFVCDLTFEAIFQDLAKRVAVLEERTPCIQPSQPSPD